MVFLDGFNFNRDLPMKHLYPPNFINTRCSTLQSGRHDTHVTEFLLSAEEEILWNPVCQFRVCAVALMQSLLQQLDTLPEQLSTALVGAYIEMLRCLNNSLAGRAFILQEVLYSAYALSRRAPSGGLLRQPEAVSVRLEGQCTV